MRDVTRRNNTKKKSPISDEEIIELREKGWSYYLMANYFKESGRKISAAALQQRCVKIYEMIGEKVPETKKKINSKDESKVNDQTLFRLKEKGFSYNQIHDYYAKKGIEINANRIMERIHEIYKKKGLGKPRKGISKSARKYDVDTIFKLRQNKLSYQKIAEIIGDKMNEEISYMTIRKICKKMYEKKGLTEPKVFKGKRIGELTGVSDKEITQLKMKGYTYGEMVRYFKNDGRSISRNNIAYRARFMFGVSHNGKRSAVDIRTADKNVMKNVLMNLKQTKGATDEQLKILANMYGTEYTPRETYLNPYRVSKDDFER